MHPEDFAICVECPVTTHLLDAMGRFCRDHGIDYRCRQTWPLNASRARWCFATQRDALAFAARFGGQVDSAVGKPAEGAGFDKWPVTC